MANSLIITRLPNDYFEFVLNNKLDDKVITFRQDLLVEENEFHFKTANGANIIKNQQIYPEDITLVIENVNFNFTTVQEVLNKLIEVRYFDWTLEGGSVSGVNRFDDLIDTFKYIGKNGYVVVVNESQQKLEAKRWGDIGYENFTELLDTPDIIEPGKYLVGNNTGDGLIFKAIPQQNNSNNPINSIGYFYYDNSGPYVPVDDGDLSVENDTEGIETDNLNTPYGVDKLWNSDTNRFDFSQLSVGDTIDVRVDFEVQTSIINEEISLTAFIGSGLESYSIKFFGRTFKNTATYAVISAEFSICIKSDSLKNDTNSYIGVNASNTTLFRIKGYYIRVLRKSLNLYQIENGDGSSTNLSSSFTPIGGVIFSDTGTDASIPAATNVSAGLLLPGEKQNIESAVQPGDLAAVATTGEYLDLLNRPTMFPPSSHTHPISEVVNLQTTLNTKENTSNKQNSLTTDGTGIKYPTVDAVNSAGFITDVNTSLGYIPANRAGDTFTGNITAPNLSGTNTGDETTASIQIKRPLKTIEGQSLEGSGNIDLNKSDVGLSNVDNTSDINKPVSSAQSTAIALKEDTANKSTSTSEISSNVKFPVWSAIVSYVTGLGYLLASVAATTYQTLSNLVTSFGVTPSDTKYPSEKLVKDSLNAKQDLLVSGTNIKTINGNSILGAGNLSVSVITYQYIRQYLPNPAFGSANTWYGWSRNSSTMLTANPQAPYGVATEPTKSGTWFADANVFMLKDVKQLNKLTLQIREGSGNQSLQIYVVVADYTSVRGNELNGQIVVNDTFTILSSSSYLRDLTIINHSDFNANSVLYIFMRCTTGAVTPQAIQLLYKFQEI